MKSFKMLMIAALTILTVSVFAQDSTMQKNKNKETAEVTYVCPMHPDVIMDKSGKCPKCGRNLTPKEKMKMEVVGLYECPAHPNITSDKPGQCSVCGSKMNLSPKEKMKMGVMKTYTCPMHPEVTGKEGDTCPKCGMKLEHNDNATGPGNVTMQFSTSPASVNPNQEVTLSLTPKMKDKPNEQVPLDVEHTKKIHLIVVSEDLSWFNHIHPELNADGSYTVKEKFPFPGKYTLFADYKPSGANHTVDNLSVTVAGTVPAAKTYGADKLSGAAGDGFSVSLSPEGGKFLTNMPMHINGVMMLNGKEVDVNTLEDYLGAKAHMVVVSLADKKYLHVHPSVEGGKFDLHTTFDKPGVYRGWIQFQSKGKVYTSDFVMNVSEGTAANMKDMKHDSMDMKEMKH